MDQGQNFVSESVQNFEHLFQKEYIKASAFHPQCNGSLERAHRVVKDFIRTIADLKIPYDDALKFTCMTYNTCMHTKELDSALFN